MRSPHLALLGVLCLAALTTSSGCSSPPEQVGADFWAGPKGTWQVVHREDFEGMSGSSADASVWNELVTGSPYNKELEYYTNRPSNLMLDGNGHLVITAQSEFFVDATGVTSTQPYTSGRVDTQHHWETTYGRIEARIKLPAGKGLWPAFWLLGSNIDSVHWPACGEVDILEMAGHDPTTIAGSLHAVGYAENSPVHAEYTLPSGTFADDFHVFAFEWAADGMRWLVDEHPYAWRTPEGMKNIYLNWQFDQPMFVILNLAVGGIYDGDPNAQTQFPAQMLVDYVQISTLVPAP